jgi:hypothetical protein
MVRDYILAADIQQENQKKAYLRLMGGMRVKKAYVADVNHTFEQMATTTGNAFNAMVTPILNRHKMKA